MAAAQAFKGGVLRLDIRIFLGDVNDESIAMLTNSYAKDFNGVVNFDWIYAWLKTDQVVPFPFCHEFSKNRLSFVCFLVFLLNRKNKLSALWWQARIDYCLISLLKRLIRIGALHEIVRHGEREPIRRVMIVHKNCLQRVFYILLPVHKLIPRNNRYSINGCAGFRDMSNSSLQPVCTTF